MKKTFLSLALVSGLITLASAQVVITEIMYNPPESNVDSLEYFEIYNNSNAAVDISNWTFTLGVTHTFPAGTVMQPGSYITLAKNANAFQLVFGFQPVVWTDGALNNSGEAIELSDANGNVIDKVTYSSAAPWPTEPNGGGSSLVLCDYNSDNSLSGSWIAATTGTGISVNGKEVFGNPNADSGCQISGTIIANADNFAVPTGQSVPLDILFNDQFIGVMTSLIVTANPASGTATVTGNRITYQSQPGYCGPDQFEYKVCNASSCGTAIVTVDVRCYPARSIATMTTENADGVPDSLHAACSLKGVVYGYNLRPLTGNLPTVLFTIIDAQGNGISVSSLNKNFGYNVQEKDFVEVRGTIEQFNGMTEIRPDTIIKESANNNLINAAVVTTLSEATESKLVRINNLHMVNPADWTTGAGPSGFNVRVVSDAHPLDTILLRIDRDVETYNAPAPAEPFDVRGLGGQFDSSSPFTSGYQILPRYNADISSFMVAAKEADFSHYVKLSPNPVSELITIEMTTDFDRIGIYNASGRLIKTFNEPGDMQKVNVSLYPAGTYFIRFEKAGSMWTSKFVKQ